eukprot:12818495-Alexandrium_andersonii.AAC.1
MHAQCGARRAQQWTEGNLSLHLKPLSLGQPRWLQERVPPQRALDGFVYSFACAFCRAVASVERKPGRAPEGWAKPWCGGCQRTRRVGNHTCQRCKLPIKQCPCSAERMGGLRQSTLRQIFCDG